MVVGEHDRRCPVADAELAEDAPNMGLHRRLGDYKPAAISPLLAPRAISRSTSRSRSVSSSSRAASRRPARPGYAHPDRRPAPPRTQSPTEELTRSPIIPRCRTRDRLPGTCSPTLPHPRRLSRLADPSGGRPDFSFKSAGVRSGGAGLVAEAATKLSGSGAGCPDSDRRGLIEAIGRVVWDRVALVVGEDLAQGTGRTSGSCLAVEIRLQQLARQEAAHGSRIEVRIAYRFGCACPSSD